MKLAAFLTAFMLFLVVAAAGQAAPLYSGVTQINNTAPWTGAAIQVTVNVSGNTTHGADFAWIQHNCTWTAVNYSTTSGAYVNLSNATTYTSRKLNISLGTACAGNCTWYVFFNTTDGAVNVTPVNRTAVYPFINGTSGVRANISSAVCQNITDMTLGFGSTTSGTIELHFNNSTDGTTSPCSYRCLNCTNFTSSNQSTFCYGKVYVSSVGTGKGIRLTEVGYVSVAAPPNMPAALGTLSLVTIIVVVSYSIKKKRGGWT